MPYREKTAWLALIAMAATFGPYFAIVWAGVLPAAGMPDLRQLALYAVVAVVQMLILGIGHLYLRRASPEEARMPPDERDRAIKSHATTSAYYVLMVGMMVVGIIMPFQTDGWTIVNAALMSIVVAEIVSYGIVVLCYRSHA